MPLQDPKTTLLSVPMFDFGREFAAIREPVMAAMEAVCSRQQFILGPEVERFEQAAAAFCGVEGAVGCARGTDALWLALAALGIGPGDAVITTPFSFFATVSAVLRAGAKPLLADIDERTFNLSPEATANLLGERRVAAILPVHLYGQCAEMSAFAELTATHDLKLVEDAAQAFGARWNGVRAGALGDAAAFSFYPTKNLSAFGDAGAATSTDPEVGEHMKRLRNHGAARRYYHEEIGWNARMDAIQGAVLRIKLHHIEEWNQTRRAIAANYDHLLQEAGLAGGRGTSMYVDESHPIALPATSPEAKHIFHQYVIRAHRRDELREFLQARKIGCEIYYPVPLHLQECFAYLGYKPGDFPESERACLEVLALPIFPELTKAEQEVVIAAIAEFYSA